jgi:hypothetical protein
MSRLSRTLTAVGALLLSALYFAPLWSIQLFAPQYPEGLGMHIRLTTVVGDRPNDLNTINQLNHYIGMKAIEPEGIPELRYFPIIVSALIALGLLAALLGKRRLVVAWLTGLAAFGVAGLVDFWRWSYDYGHNLDFEHAVIKVPGMTYQPPIIGTKQLLNFTASSWPSVGAYLALAAFALGMVALFMPRSARGIPARQVEGTQIAQSTTKRAIVSFTKALPLFLQRHLRSVSVISVPQSDAPQGCPPGKT